MAYARITWPRETKRDLSTPPSRANFCHDDTGVVAREERDDAGDFFGLGRATRAGQFVLLTMIFVDFEEGHGIRKDQSPFVVRLSTPQRPHINICQPKGDLHC